MDAASSTLLACAALCRQRTTRSTALSWFLFCLNVSLITRLIRFLCTAFFTLFLAIAKPSRAPCSEVSFTKTVNKASVLLLAPLNTFAYSGAVFNLSCLLKACKAISLTVRLINEHAL